MRFYRTEILSTFDIRRPVNSTPIIALTYPKKYKEDINLKTWNKAIIDFINANKQDLNGFLLYYIVYYKDSKYDDTTL
jgi:hypothetical protein